MTSPARPDLAGYPVIMYDPGTDAFYDFAKPREQKIGNPIRNEEGNRVVYLQFRSGLATEMELERQMSRHRLSLKQRRKIETAWKKLPKPAERAAAGSDPQPT